MKCKKIVAMIVALASFMAFATSGFATNATVSTTTTYDFATKKVEVTVDVSAAKAGSEVTYLVNNGSKIIYIDQKTANANTGDVQFKYKVAQADMGLSQVAQLGTNGDVAISSAASGVTLSVDAVADNGHVDNGATIAYFADANCSTAIASGYEFIGSKEGEKIWVQIIAPANKMLKSVKIGGAIQDLASNIFEIKAGEKIEVELADAEIDSSLDHIDITLPGAENENFTATDNKVTTNDGKEWNVENYKAQTTLLKPTGNKLPKEMGVKVTYGGVNYKFPAYTTSGSAEISYDNTTVYAVKVIFPDNTTFTSIPYADAE